MIIKKIRGQPFEKDIIENQFERNKKQINYDKDETNASFIFN
jgi:hypothetical protein